MKKQTKKESNNQTFIGQYFHTFEVNGPVKYQGRVVAEAGHGYYLCELYSWMDGQSANSQLFHIDKMAEWSFYPTAEQMNYRYEVSVRHIEPRDLKMLVS